MDQHKSDNLDREQILFLKNFLLQSLEGTNLKTSLYPKEFLDLKMKVSFGMGVAARIPWIGFLAEGMSISEGYYPVYLFYKDKNLLVLAYGISETSDFPDNWNNEVRENNKFIKDVVDNPARYGNSYVYAVYEISINDGMLEIRSNGKNVPDSQLLDELKDIVRTYKKILEIEIKSEGSIISSGLFYMEQQLEDFIIENWNETELGKKLDLIHDDGVLKSQQFQTDIGRIDILAKDKKTGAHVVIELKRNQTSDDTVGQVLRYMGWVKQNLRDDNVRGIVIAGKYDEKLQMASQMVSDKLDVYIYEVNFSLKQHSKL